MKNLIMKADMPSKRNFHAPIKEHSGDIKIVVQACKAEEGLKKIVKWIVT